MALAGLADYLVTGNMADYPVEKRRGCAVVSPAEFVRIWISVSRTHRRRGNNLGQHTLALSRALVTRWVRDIHQSAMAASRRGAGIGLIFAEASAARPTANPDRSGPRAAVHRVRSLRRTDSA